jgi:hypothetical protein
MVPRDVIAEIARKLSKITGPLAPMILRHDAAALGESLDAFPVRRLPELLESLLKDIDDENTKAAWRQRFQT